MSHLFPVSPLGATARHYGTVCIWSRPLVLDTPVIRWLHPPDPPLPGGRSGMPGILPPVCRCLSPRRHTDSVHHQGGSSLHPFACKTRSQMRYMFIVKKHVWLSTAICFQIPSHYQIAILSLIRIVASVFSATNKQVLVAQD